MEPTPSYRSVAAFSSEEEAVAAVRQLLERGVGADIGRSESSDNLLVGATTVYAVLVLENDAVRAAEHLGVDPPQPRASVGPAPLATAKVAAIAAGGTEEEHVYRMLGGRVVMTGKQMTTVLIVYALALIVIPAAAYWAVRTVLAQDPVEGPEPATEIDPQRLPLFEREDS